MAKKRIGDLLRTRGIITEEQLNQGLEAQHRTSRRLGVTLVELGFLSEEQLASALADALHLPRVDLAQVTVDWGAIHLLKPQLCEARGLFPFALDSQGGRKTLVVAMSDPLDVRAIEEIEFNTGLKISPRVASLSGIRAAILRYYHRVKQTPAPRVPPVPPVQLDLTPKAEFTQNDGGTGEPAAPPLEALRRQGRTPLERRDTRRKISSSDRRSAEPLEPASAAQRTVSEELALLFGQGADAPDLAHRLEALVRLLIRKGVFSEKEWRAALSQGAEAVR